MTQQRGLKRKIRARMKDTGERYTVARRHILEMRKPESTAPMEMTPGHGPFSPMLSRTYDPTARWQGQGVK